MNQKLKRGFALGMSFILMFSLTGCKKGNSEKEAEDKKSEPPAEYGYNTEYKELNNFSSMDNVVMSGNTLYFTSHVYDDMQKETVSLHSFDISSPENTKTYASYENNDSEDAADVYTDIPYFYPDDNGNVTYFKIDMTYGKNTDLKDSAFSPDLGDIPENAVITEEYIQRLNIDLESVGLEFRDINSMTVAQVIELYKQLISDNETEVQPDYEDFTAALITVDSDGKEVSSKDISQQMTIYFSAYYSAFDKEGNLYLYNERWSETDSDALESTMTIFNISSLETETVTIEDMEISSMTSDKNGDILAVVTDEDWNCSIAKWDKEKKEFIIDEDASISAMWIDTLYPGDNDELYYIDEGILYKYDRKKKKDEKLLKFIDCNILSDCIVTISNADEEHINVITSENSFNKSKIVLNKLTRVKASEIAKKTEITLGCLGANRSVENAIIEFNRASSDYKIVLKEYLDSFDDETDYDNAITQFNNDIVSGNGPDLIDLSSIDYDQYKDSGLFADLYEYLKTDSDFSKKNLNENILKLLEYNGTLLALPTTYMITALASAKNTLADSLLTIDKFAELIKNNPDKDMFGNDVSQETILRVLLLYNKNYFVDYKNKTCNFTDGTFEKILNIAKSFPTEKELEDVYEEDNTEYEEERVYNGKQLFYQLNIYDPNEYQIAEYLLKNDINISGYPSIEGNQIAAYISSALFAINANSKYKEDCWNFIKILYEKTGEFGYYDGFPIDNDKLDELLNEYATPNMVTDENGNQVEQPSIYGYGDSSFEIEIYALSQEQINKIKELANSVSVLSPQDYTEDIYEIIDEEAASFFSGAKSAEEVCSVIQSRINIQINENS